MSKELTTQANAALVNWDDQKMQLQIKESFGKGLSDTEWTLFLNMGRATKLNPFLREIWAVKFGTNPVSVFIGRDGYRRSAQNNPEYEYHYCDAVYSNDEFVVTKGEVTHTYNLKDRGTLVGAYCIVKRRNATIAAMNYVELSEYMQAFGVWKTKKATMIKKVAEAQGLRASFQELFAGTYEESEKWEETQETVQKEAREQVAPVAASVLADKMITKDQLQELKSMWTTYANAAEIEQKDYAAKGSEKLIALFGKTKLTDLTHEEANKFMETLITETDILQSLAPKSEKKTEEPILATETVPIEPDMITPEQTKKLHAVWREYCEATGIPATKTTSERKKLMKQMFKVDSSTEMTTEQASAFIDKISFDLQKSETF